MANGFTCAKLFPSQFILKRECAEKRHASLICITLMYCCRKFPDILFDFWNRRNYREKQPACSLPHRFNV